MTVTHSAMRECFNCRRIAFEPMPIDDAFPSIEYCTECLLEHEQDIQKPDPYIAMLVSGYYTNLPMYRIESIYRRNSRDYVDVSRDGQTISYRVAVVEQCHGGADVEVLHFEEIEWADPTTKHYERGEEP